jgi:hypothetical protein
MYDYLTENTKGVISSHDLKDRQYNGHKGEKQTLVDIMQHKEIKDCTT